MENKDHNDNYNDDECCICYSNEKMKNFSCKTCKASICVKCFNKINVSKFDYEKYNEVYNYRCPICAIENTYNFTNFGKDDLIYLIRQDLTKIFNNLILNPKVRIGKLVNNLNEVEINNLKLKQKLIDMEDENLKLKATIEKYKKTSESLKLICEKGKNKTINKMILIPFYENS
jgi:hypothetical protein